MMKRHVLLTTITTLLVLGGCTQKEYRDFTGESIDAFKTYYNETEYDTTEQYSDEVQKNTIISQNKDDVIHVVVSKGAPLRHIPDYGSVSLKSCKTDIESFGFLTDQKEEYSDTIRKGDVISIYPVEAKKGDTITITVSKGIEQVKVQDVTGKTKDEAVKILEEGRLKAEIKEEYSDTVQEGTVISTEHAGESIDHDSTVVLTVSKGPKPAETPVSQNNSYPQSNNNWYPTQQPSVPVQPSVPDQPYVPGAGPSNTPIGPEPAYGTVSFNNENVNGYYYWHHAEVTYTYENGGWTLSAVGADASNMTFLQYAMAAFPRPEEPGYEGETVSATVWVYLGG